MTDGLRLQRARGHELSQAAMSPYFHGQIAGVCCFAKVRLRLLLYLKVPILRDVMWNVTRSSVGS